MTDKKVTIKELWTIKGHKLALWSTLWTTKWIAILWTTALLISQTAYLFKLSRKFNIRYLAGGAGVRSAVESVSFVWTHGARDLLQLTGVEYEQRLTTSVPQRPHLCRRCRSLHCCCCYWHCHFHCHLLCFRLNSQYLFTLTKHGDKSKELLMFTRFPPQLHIYNVTRT